MNRFNTLFAAAVLAGMSMTASAQTQAGVSRQQTVNGREIVSAGHSPKQLASRFSQCSLT